MEDQVNQLERYGCNFIYYEHASGKNLDDRPELRDLLSTVKKGDKIVFTKLDRFARSTLDALNIATDLHNRGVGMVILDFGGQPLDITTATGKLTFTQFAAFAEFERQLMLERQRVGIERARRAGKYVGRIKKYHAKHAGMLHAIELRKTTNKTVNEICKITNVSRASLYRALAHSGRDL
jgi:DNA invertase Pin-like site-specific DNA recombinase